MLVRVALAGSFFCGVVCLHAQSPYHTVFGLRLGEPLTSSVAECSTHEEKFLGVVYHLYDENDKQTCFRRRYPEPVHYVPLSVGFGTPMTDEQVAVKFPIGKRPMVMSGFELDVRIVGGNLEAVAFETGHGMNRSSDVVKALAEKYGSPTSDRTGEWRDIRGVVYPTRELSWSLPGLSVSFRNVFTKVETGTVFIQTNKWTQWNAEQLQKRKASSTL